MIVIENNNNVKIKEMELIDVKTMVNIWFPNNDFNYEEIIEFYGEYTQYQFERTLVDLNRKRKLIIRLIELDDFRVISKNRFTYVIGIGTETPNTTYFKLIDDKYNFENLFKCKISTNCDIIHNDKLNKDKLIKYINNNLDLKTLR